MSLPAAQAAGPKERKATAAGRHRQTRRNQNKARSSGDRAAVGHRHCSFHSNPGASPLPLLSNGTSRRYLPGGSPPSRELALPNQLRRRLPGESRRACEPPLTRKWELSVVLAASSVWGVAPDRTRQRPATLPAPAVSLQGLEVVGWRGRRGGRESSDLEIFVRSFA